MIQPFVDTEWVRARRDEVVLADCRWYTDGRSGRDAYAAGHVPGAIFVDLDTALTRHLDDPAEAGRHPLPEPEDFAAAMGALGIGDDDTVVAYDDAGGVIAARLVWMLRATDHEAALLDGGLEAWDDELEPGETSRGPVEFTARAWPADRVVSIDEVAAASHALADRAADAPPIIDARPADRFAGAPDNLDPRRPHPRRPLGPLPGEPRRRPPPARARRAPHPLRGRGRERGHLLLRFRRHRLPQPARDGAGRARPRSTLSGLLVPVESRPRSACTNRRGLTPPSG